MLDVRLYFSHYMYIFMVFYWLELVLLAACWFIHMKLFFGMNRTLPFALYLFDACIYWNNKKNIRIRNIHILSCRWDCKMKIHYLYIEASQFAHTKSLAIFYSGYYNLYSHHSFIDWLRVHVSIHSYSICNNWTIGFV